MCTHQGSNSKSRPTSERSSLAVAQVKTGKTRVHGILALWALLSRQLVL